MHLIYIDGSFDRPHHTFSAISIPSKNWFDAFKTIKEWRRCLQETEGLYLRKELHAWKLVSGRGKISPSPISKWRRCQIFREGLQCLVRIKYARVFNAYHHNENWAFERLLNRINRTLRAWNSVAILICDEGKEYHYTRLVRKMSVFNPIPSRYGTWLDTGRSTRNIPLENIIEDPFFKDSSRSYFIQLADFCAYALLRKECPIASKNKYGINAFFKILNPICVKEANPRDPDGVIR